MNDEKIFVTKATMPTLSEYQSFLEKIWQTGQLTNNGPLCRELEGRLIHELGVENLTLVGNGTLALQLAIRALGLTGEIITTPYSYVATTNAILWEHCTPVFVDIEPETFCIDPELIELAITDRTTAILATHVYGYPCDVDRIEAIASQHGLKVIYDAAHAFGVKLNGKSLLNHGDCSTLSFHATKLFHTAEGGAVVCKEKAVSEKLSLMSKFGHIGEDNYFDIGINAKMSELHAAMGLAVLPKVHDIIEARATCSSWYDSNLSNTDIQRPKPKGNFDYNYAYYPAVFENHQAMSRVREKLIENGVIPRRYFHPSLNTLPFLPEKCLRQCPVSEDIAGRVLCLPLYVGLEETAVEHICHLVNAASHGR